jgi:Concanavalin A-like lectin/glucanases superfamily/Carboxypeptidase regulatory-like domain
VGGGWARRLLAVALIATGAAVPLLLPPAASAAPAAPPRAPGQPSCVDTQPDAASAARTAVTCRQRVEILAERTEYSQTFANPDGTRTFEESVEPQRARKGSAWVPIDTHLRKVAGGVAPVATVLPVRFSGGGTGALARIGDGSRELSMSWSGRLPAPSLEGDTAVYRDVLPGVDLRVTAQALGFSELVVVRTPAAAADPRLATLHFGLATKGVSTRRSAGGGFDALDAHNRVVFSAPAPLMWDATAQAQAQDAAKAPGAAAPKAAAPKAAAPGAATPKAAAPGSAAPSPAGGASRGRAAPVEPRQAVMGVRVGPGDLTLLPDLSILHDPAARFPLYLDPSVTGYISGNAWTTVWSKYPGSSFWQNSTALNNGGTYGSAGAGRTRDCSTCSQYIIRSMFRMDTSKIIGKHILDAKFRVEQRWSWTCSPASNAKLWLTGGISSGTTWNSQPAWLSTTAQTMGNRAYGSPYGCLGVGTIEFGVTSMVAQASANRWTGTTVGLRAVDEGSLLQWKRFNHSSPKLVISYDTDPNAPGSLLSDGKACASGAGRPYVVTATPILSVAQSDPDTDQQNLTTSLYWWPVGGARNTTDVVTVAAGNPSTVSKAVPAGKLTDGASYVWQAQTSDGSYSGGWSGACEFTVDSSPPPTPGSVASTDYPTSGAHGGVGISGSFAITAPSLRPYEVTAYAWTLDGGVSASAAPTVPANGTNFGATLPVSPLHDGVNTLRVWAVDRGGRFSTTPFSYTFSVKAGSGPAAEWLFDEASGSASDATGHSNAAALAGGAARVTGRGGTGSALSLNGSTAYAATTGSVQTPHPDTGVMIPVATNSTFTVTARVRLNATGGADVAAVSEDGSRTSAYYLGYAGGSNRWVFSLAGSDVDAPALATASSDAAPTAGLWTHLAGVYDASTHAVRLYVNGVAQAAAPTLSGGFNATGPVAVGRRRAAGANAGFLNGAVDDVRVYNFAETAAKLAAMALPLPAKITLSASSAYAGTSLSVTLDGRGDTNVTSFKYNVDSTSLTQTTTPTAAGGTRTLSVAVGTAAGQHILYAAGVDAGGRVSPLAQVTFTVLAVGHVSGWAMDLNFLPVGGAAVTLTPGGYATTSAADGSFAFPSVVPGSYTVTAAAGGQCGLLGTLDIAVPQAGLDAIMITMLPVADGTGYTCDQAAVPFAAANDAVVPLSGDDAVTQIGLPFAFPFYGEAYTSAWLDTNGTVSFTDPGGSHPYLGGAAIPSAEAPNSVLAPFWDDLVVDASASVRTSSTGTGAGRRFTIEWRNVYRKAVASERLSFETVLAPDGTVTFDYDSLDNSDERGAHAAVGIEAPDGSDGLPFSTGQPALASGQAVVFDYPGGGSPIQTFDLSGTLLDAAGNPAAGVTVSVTPGGQSTVTGAGGVWSLPGLVADSYTVSAATGGVCGTSVTEQVELDANTTRTLRLGPGYGDFGYACAVGASGYQPLSAVAALSGDDADLNVDLPFPVTLRGRSYGDVWVGTNGVLNFGIDPGADPDNAELPVADAVDAVVAPFWDDLNVDASASVRTGVLGTAPNRQFVVEWRNALVKATGDRVTFEAALGENGQIAFWYGALSTPGQLGSGATVGLQGEDDPIANQFLYEQAALPSNGSIRYTPAAPGTVSGTVTAAVTTRPIAGATVTLQAGDAIVRTTTAAADGGYSFTGVPVGGYTVDAATSDGKCAGQYAEAPTNEAGGATHTDVSLMVDGDEFGYTCTTGTQAFVSGTTLLPLTGDDEVAAANPPFPISLYGHSYTSAWVDTNGLVTFQPPAGSAYDITPIPSLAAPHQADAAAYPFWHDWVVDAGSAIYTATTGTAPNRRWVVEWRNVRDFWHADARVRFEAIFDESGTITFNYADLDPTSWEETGATATVGIEDATGLFGFQYLYNDRILASGKTVVYQPGTPATGSVTGVVSCQGAAVAGVPVTTAGHTTTTAADGSYTIGGVGLGPHPVIATLGSGACHGSASEPVTLSTTGSYRLDFALAATPAWSGYTLTEQPAAFLPADTTVLALTGDDEIQQVALPFPVTFYGQSYASIWVDTNGVASFVQPDGSAPEYSPIPSPAAINRTNGAVYPFWHDWMVDAAASVRTAVLGAAPSRRFVIEWRNVVSYESPTTRATFEVILDESGVVTFNYSGLDGSLLGLGGYATVGIENADGTLALQYSSLMPVLRSGTSLRFTPPTS